MKKLCDYFRNYRLQKGFKIAETITIADVKADVKNGNHTLTAINAQTGSIEKIKVPSNSAYAQIDKQLSGIIWKNIVYIDMKTKSKMTGVYLGELKACRKEATKIFGKKHGIIIFINGKEPGKGTIPLHNYVVKKGDVIEIVYKKAGARYFET